MTVGPLSDEAAVELIRRRLDLHGGTGAYAPVPPEAFKQFSDWMYGEYIARDADLLPPDDRQTLLENWLSYQAEAAQNVARRLQPRSWQFFDALARDGGRCRAGEHEHYGFNKQQQMGSTVTSLVTVNLLLRETDPENATRFIHSITPTGWLVFFHRNGYDTPIS